MSHDSFAAMYLFRRRKIPRTAFDRLERLGNDDFHLLSELGPAEFSNEHLFELRHKAYCRIDRFDRISRLNSVVGATTLGWIGLGAIAHNTSRLLSFISFIIATLFMAGFFGGVIFLKVRYESRGELEHSIYEIEEELRRRMSIRPKKPRGW